MAAATPPRESPAADAPTDAPTETDVEVAAEAAAAPAAEPRGAEEQERKSKEPAPPTALQDAQEPESTERRGSGGGAVAALETELQCVLCHDVLFKPVSVLCGHSFCRVCLMQTFLSRPAETAQCPTCRADILRPLAPSAPPAAVFSVNVTLWNVVQLALPALVSARRRQRPRSSQRQAAPADANADADADREEEEEYASLLDQVAAKWRIHALQHQSAAFHDRRGGGSDGDGDDSDEDERGEDEEDGERQARQRRRLYPEVRVESTVDGRLALSRNVVLDTTDANEDGYASMRVALAIVEFPSIVELYSEHQECEVAVVKLEEDEDEADGGAPFFLDAHGNDDDAFILPNYYNEVTLRVRDEAGNCVLERTRGAQRGTVQFPSLRLDVPGGEYTFTFSDDLYGVELSVTTTLREPHEASDTPLPEYISLVADEAREGSRGRRGRSARHSDEEEEEEDNDGERSDDSFIVDDEDEREVVAAFSGGEEGESEGEWRYSSDDEARDEERERRRAEKRRRRARNDPDRVPELLDESGNAHDGEDSDAEEEQHEVPRGRRRNANQIIDSDDEEAFGHEEEEKRESEKDEDEEGGAEQQKESEGRAGGDRLDEEGSEKELGEDEEDSGRPAKRARRVQPLAGDSDQDEHVEGDGDLFDRAHPVHDEEVDEQRSFFDAVQDEEEETDEDEGVADRDGGGESESGVGADGVEREDEDESEAGREVVEEERSGQDESDSELAVDEGESGGEDECNPGFEMDVGDDLDELDRDPDEYPDDGFGGGFDDGVDVGDEEEFFEG